MPISQTVHAVLHEGADLAQTFSALWSRPIEAEPRALELPFADAGPIDPFNFKGPSSMNARTETALPPLSARRFTLATDLSTAPSSAERTGRGQRSMTGSSPTGKRSIGLIFVTGRDPEFILNMCAEKGLPWPELVVGDVGTTIAHGSPRRRSCRTHRRAGTGHCRALAGQVATGARDAARPPGLKLQPTPFRYRVSYYVDLKAYEASAVDKVEELGLDSLVSDNRFFDVLPRGVSKGPSLRRLIAHPRHPRGPRAWPAGDTLNDLSMLVCGLKAVAVGNSEGELIRHVAGHAPRSTKPALMEQRASWRRLPPSNSTTFRKEALMPSNLVIVYHRQPYEEVVEDGKVVFKENKSPNGIVPTLKSFFGRGGWGGGGWGRGWRGVWGGSTAAPWVAWKEAEDVSNPDFERVVPEIDDAYGSYTVSRLPLTSAQIQELLPMLARRRPSGRSCTASKERYNYDPVDWPTFREVNWAFAEAAAAEAADGAVVWIHDYNLWLVPGYLRQLRPDVKITFFHHTPFPGADIFNVLPWREEIPEEPAVLRRGGLPHSALRQQFRVGGPKPAGNECRATRKGQGRHVLTCHRAGSEQTVPDHAGIPRVGTIALQASPVGVDVDYMQGDLAEEIRRPGRARGATSASNWRCQGCSLSFGRPDYTKGGIEAVSKATSA